MKICVFGAGAIGGFLAGYLARSGAEVSVVARGRQLEAIRAEGLTVQSADETFTVRVQASDDPAALGPQDGVFVTVKAPALPGIAPMLAPLLTETTPVAFLVNGVPWWYFHGHGGPWDGRRLPAARPRRWVVDGGGAAHGRRDRVGGEFGAEAGARPGAEPADAGDDAGGAGREDDAGRTGAVGRAGGGGAAGCDRGAAAGPDLGEDRVQPERRADVRADGDGGAVDPTRRRLWWPRRIG